MPSSHFTRPSATVEAVSPPPTPSYYQQQPLSPRATETKVMSRPPLAHQKSTTSTSAIEALTRQISMSSVGSADPSSPNGQPTIVVKDAKVTASSELIGAVTRAKEGEQSTYGTANETKPASIFRFTASNDQATPTVHSRYWFVGSTA